MKFLADPILMTVNRVHPLAYSKARTQRENGIQLYICYLLVPICFLFPQKYISVFSTLKFCLFVGLVN